MYAAGSANTSYLSWAYTDGSQKGTAGIISGKVTFPAGLSPVGEYEVRLFFAGTLTLRASATFSVLNGPPPTIATSEGTYDPSQAIVANFTNASGSPSDWIGLYNAGAPNTALLQWLYVNGTQTATAGIVSGNVTFSKGLASAGNYEVRLFSNNTQTEEASAAFSVQAP